jgi:hypothetical protein
MPSPPSICGRPMHTGETVEMSDLRKPPIHKARAVPSPYGRRMPVPKITTGLPIGTQARFISAAATAAALGWPLNTLLTVRWNSLFCDRDVNPLRVLPTPDRIDHLVERLRKWLQRCGAPPVYIWVRENADTTGEHWHFAFHLPKRRARKLVAFVAKLTGEAQAMGSRPPPRLTEGEFAIGELGSWHLASDTRPERKGYYLAAYLGKGEPSERFFRGRLHPNTRKPVRGQAFGGYQPDDRYDSGQGCIEGTTCRKDRFFIANVLKREVARSRSGTNRNARNCDHQPNRQGKKEAQRDGTSK